MLAVDISRYSGPVSVEQWRIVKALGYDLAIVGLWTGVRGYDQADAVIRSAYGAGLHVAAYVGLEEGWTGAHHVDKALSLLTSEAQALLKFIAVDVELRGVDLRMVWSAVDALNERGFRPIIYTAYSAWRNFLGDTEDFKSLPLWNANYKPDPDLDLALMYGGWTRAVGHQYRYTTFLAGPRLNVDISLFDDQFVLAGEEHDMVTVIDGLTTVWTKLDQIQLAMNDCEAGRAWNSDQVRQWAEEAKQDGVVAIKKALGLQQ